MLKGLIEHGEDKYNLQIVPKTEMPKNPNEKDKGGESYRIKAKDPFVVS